MREGRGPVPLGHRLACVPTARLSLRQPRAMRGAAGLLDPQARLREARQDERGQQVVPAASRLGRCGLCVRPWWPASPKIMESELGPQMWG